MERDLVPKIKVYVRRRGSERSKIQSPRSKEGGAFPFRFFEGKFFGTVWRKMLPHWWLWLFPWTSLGEAREGAREQTRSAECGIGTEPQEQAVANCRKQGTGGQALPFSSFWREV